MASVYERALELHKEWKGKVIPKLNCPVETNEDLTYAYTPGVAAPCLEIQKDPHAAYDYTWKGNTIAVISDGSAVLGLGNIGAQAAMPVMEGKCALFKRFGDVNAVPLVLDVHDADSLVSVITALAPTYGGINLEDIASPLCVEVERRLIEDLDIPIFHDDQHGTAICVCAAVINALKLIGKEAHSCKVVLSGAGAAGFSIAKLLHDLGVGNILAFDSRGIVHSDRDDLNFVKREMLEFTNNNDEVRSLEEAMKGSDIFVGVSAKDLITPEMVSSMNHDAIVLAMANPEPEILYSDAKAAGARVAGTGRSDFPNQVNNVLVFPGIFKGMLQCPGAKITDEIKLAAAFGLAACVTDEELNEEYVIPSAFAPGVADAVAQAVVEAAQNQK